MPDSESAEMGIVFDQVSGAFLTLQETVHPPSDTHRSHVGERVWFKFCIHNNLFVQ